jgi:hypothetical protein
VSNAVDRYNQGGPVGPAHVTQSTAVEQARAVAEVAAAVQVAQQCPRDMRRAWTEMQEACSRKGLADRAFYAVRNRGNGPTVHLARELARIWGNMDYGVHELHRDDARGMSEIRAYAWDQQTNVRSSRTFQVPHRRMGGGAPLTDLTEVYLNNQNIGARAVRECIMSALPADFVEEAQAHCRATITRGDGTPLLDRVAKMVEVFHGIGVTVPMIESRLGRPRGQWTAVDVADLQVVFRSIDRRETTVDVEFPPPRLTADDLAGPPPAAAAPERVVRPHGPDLHLFDDHQADRVLAAVGQQRNPGHAETKPITDWCEFETPDGPCDLPAGHATGPQLDGYDGHDVVRPTGGDPA